MLQPEQKETILKELWNDFYDWVDSHSTRGLTDILDFAEYHRHIDCWSVLIDEERYTNPSIELLIKLYAKSNQEI